MKTSVKRGIRLPVLLACAALVGCATDQASVEDRSIDDTANARSVAPARSAEGSYRVVRGDTLYAIAFTRGLDYRDVAAWNGIAPPYTILVGQELRLTPAGVARVAAGSSTTASPSANAVAPRSSATTASRTASAAPPLKSDSMFEDVPSQFAPPPSAPKEPPRPAATVAKSAVVEVSPAPPARADVEAVSPAESPGAAAPPTAAPPAAAALPAPAPVVVAPPLPIDRTPEPSAKPISEGAVANAGGIAWHWPNTGKLLGGFVAGDQTKQGVDIAGSAGDPVRAAADGEVVYSGNGLIGYGELIIVKHNASFLSAYGHNRKRLVQEGEKVRAGQQIAEMGSSASSRDELHFEIRKNGKPVNPLDYLPGR